jgi:hypothetical protein
MRDLLKSFGWGIRALHQLDAATIDAIGPVHPDVDVPLADDFHHAEPVAALPEVRFGMQLDAVADLEVGQLLAVGVAGTGGHGIAKFVKSTHAS